MVHQPQAWGVDDRKIAHCVGDVDKSTFSENLGVGVGSRPGIKRPHQPSGGPRSAWWEEASGLLGQIHHHESKFRGSSRAANA